jgi:hypothetical protein
MHGQYSRDDLAALLGDPISTETYLTIPGGQERQALIFQCGCHALPNNDRFDLAPPCRRHGGIDAVHISDRRCGPTALTGLSFEATGLLAELVSAQEQDERDLTGCAHHAYPAAGFLHSRRACDELMHAGILTRRADGDYQLRWFNCYDEAAGEWY